MKKIFTCVSAVVLALSLQAAETIEDNGLFFQLNDNQTATLVAAQNEAKKYEQETIVIPVSVTKDEVVYPVVEIGKGAFRNATASSITFAEGSQVVTLGMQAFQAAVNLSELELPEGIQLIPMTSIHNATATNPMQMKRLVLPSTVDSLALFSICLPQLEVIEFKGATPPSIATKETATWTQNPWQISTTNVCNTATDAVVIVPNGALEAYQNTAWIGDYFTTIVEKSNYDPALRTVKVSSLAAFNAVADGEKVRLSLSNVKVNAFNDLFSQYYVEDATAATVFTGAELTVGTALNGSIIGTKKTNDVDYINDPALAVEHELAVTDATGVTATETELTPTVMTIEEACAQENYARLITIENVTITASGRNKVLTDANENTIKARDLFGVLSEEFVWPEEAASVTGICLYYMNGWYIMPISEAAIVAKDATGIEATKVSEKAVKFIENGQLFIRYNGKTYNVLGK